MEASQRSYQEDKRDDGKFPRTPPLTPSIDMQFSLMQSLFSFGRQVARGKAIVILLPPWMQSIVFLAFTVGR